MHWLLRRRLLILTAISLFWTGLVVVAHFYPSFPFLSNIWRSEQAFQDLLRREGRKTATRPDFVFVGIDQETLQFQPFDEAQIANNRALQLMTERPFPWSREVWALLLDRLFKSGARLVVFDLVFSRTNDGDPPFRETLDRYRDKIVVGANFDFSGVRDFGGSAKNDPPNPSLISPPQMEDDRVGYVVFFPDALDQKVRAARYTITDRQLARQSPVPGELPYESLSARAMEKLGHSADVPRDLQSHPIRFSTMDAYLPPRPLWELFDEKLWHANYAGGNFFRDKIVLIGPSAQILHDFVDTPLGPDTPGPVLHLNALAAGLSHEFLTNTPRWVNFMGVIIAGLLAWTLIAWVRRPALCLLTLVGVSVAYLGVGRILYDQLGLILVTVPTLSAFLLTGVSGKGFDYVLERLEKLRTRRTLERYVSKNLVKEILDNPGGYYSSMLGSRKPVTVLFCDIVGFTTLIEHADPVVLVKKLNEYLSRMVTNIFENGGTLDKFIGDAVMGVWGNVSSRGVAEDAKAAVGAALGMRDSLRELNEQWRAEGKTGLEFGIGINQGEAVVGNIGSYEPHERLDPTVIGDAVNLASRLEGLTRIYGVDILLGETVSSLVRDEFHLRTVARVQVKGKSEPVDICGLIAARGGNVDPEFLNWLAVYEDGIRKFRERDFTQAKILFSRFLEFYPEDTLAKMYLERALEYEKEPPDEAWNAVEVFRKK
jgi:adenylate cyclase